MPHDRFSSPGMQDIEGLLQSSAWFVELPAEAQEQVLGEMSQIEVPAGGYLYRRGEVLKQWCCVMDGLLKWAVTAEDGRTVTIAGLSRGSWFGEGAVINQRPLEADIVALRPSRVVSMPIACFEWLRSSQPQFNAFLVKQLNERMYWFIDWFAAQNLLGTDSLVARALVGLFHPWLHPGSHLRLTVTQSEIANLAGISRQRCNGSLGRMAEAGLIRISYGSVEVIDLGALRGC